MMNFRKTGFAGIWCLLMGMASFSQNIEWISWMDSSSVFSSPRPVDLNGDGVKDIIIGGGKEAQPTRSGVGAYDGTDGSLIWLAPARDQVYGSAIFHDINADGVDDAFLVGRGAQFFCLDGATGSYLWEFWPDSLGVARDSGIFQFYNPQFVPDQNNDGIPDLVVTNGGDATQGPLDTTRPPGWLMLVSGLDGSTLARDTVPDKKETYHSPLIRQNAAGVLEILFGTGGERIRGKYFRVTLPELLAGNINGAEILATDSAKGFICPPALVDLTGDTRYDIVVPALNGRLIALEGESGNPLWEVRKPGFETYVSPAAGNFTGDPTPDIFAIFARGIWPFYGKFHEVLIDGATGQVVRTDSADFYHFSTPNVVDVDNDGVDEVLLTRNYNSGIMSSGYNQTFLVRDFNDTTEFQFGALQTGISIFSTPLLEDIDQDQELDLIFAWHPVQGSWNAFNGAHIARMSMGFYQSEIPWGSYLGTWWDGTYQANLPVTVAGTSPVQLLVYPNPTRNILRVDLPSEGDFRRIEILNPEGKVLFTSDVPEIDLSGLGSGLYFYRVHSRLGMASGRIMKIN